MKKVPFEEKFFSNDDEKSFYWAGMLAADGSLKNKMVKVSKTSQSHVKGVSLSLIEKDMIEKFLSDLKCAGRKITEKHYTTQNGNKILYKIDLSSHKMFDDLHRFGLTTNKSLTLNMPDWLKIHPLNNHFIRGYFDGDGCITLSGKSKQLEFAGTENMLNSIHEVIKSNIEATIRSKVLRHDNSYHVRYTGNILVPKIGDFLYKNATVWLERKREKIIA
jgi:intein/homing endonuclease